MSPFKVGSSKAKQSDSQTSRKIVLIKKVPNIMSNELLLAYPSTSFGNITKMYRLQEESLKKDAKKLKRRKHHCYSVEFAASSSAEKAAQVGKMFIRFQNEAVLIEK